MRHVWGTMVLTVPLGYGFILGTDSEQLRYGYQGLVLAGKDIRI